MKKLLIITILLFSLVSCSREELNTNCSKISNIGFTSETGYYINLQNGDIIYTGYVLPEYEVGDRYCIE